ncbi:DegT/DnrJ/EryC1/StrS family aminotransferase [Synergistaceae bacterium OttesenSCG-928-I11]|nr:DegT/DnrJ/EryC1/StrS family aminotransferase [Synergistaceae bacterium OttesenSCG-928-I11]
MATTQQIPSFDLKRNYKRVEDEIKEALESVLASQHFIMGPDVAAFEQEVASYLEIPHAVSCASGTDSLVLALMALGIGPGDEVITTPFSFFATASCIARTGAKPVFVDVHPDTYNISMDLVKAAVTDRTKAFIPVHLFGQLCRVEEIVDFLAQRKIALVEDCAQAFGAHRMHEGKIIRAGAWGGLGCYSFFPTKNLGAYGDAGMTTTFNEAHKDRLAKLRVHGATTTYIHEEVGINSRMDAMQAAILRVRLRHIEEWTEDRREVARRYKLLFAEHRLLEHLMPPVEDEGNRHTYHQYVVRTSRRDELHQYLAERGIVTRVYYPLSLHMQPCFASAGYGKGDFPVSEKLCGDVLALPMFPELTADEQEQVVREIANFYK